MLPSAGRLHAAPLQADAECELCVLRHLHLANEPYATCQAADRLRFADFGYAAEVLWVCTAAMIQQP